MKKMSCLILALFLMSCNLLVKKQEYVFTYEFVNANKISQAEINKTMRVLEKRLEIFGVQHNIKQEGNRLNIGIKANNLDLTSLNNVIANEGKLEFWELYNGDAFVFSEGFLFDIKQTEATNNFKAEYDLDIVFSRYKGAPEILRANPKDTLYINKVLNSKHFKESISIENSKVKFIWGIIDEGYAPLYAARPNSKNKASLTSKGVIAARYEFSPIGTPVVSIEMNEHDALIWEHMTGKAFNNKTHIAIALNDLVYSAPGVNMGPIKGGRTQISSNFTIQEAKELSIILSSQEPISMLKLVNEKKLGK